MSELTANLKHELEKTNQAFTRWTSKQSEWLESADTNFGRVMDECEQTISTLKENESHLDKAMVMTQNLKQQQVNELAHYRLQIEKLNEALRYVETQRQDLKETETSQLLELENAKRDLELTKAKVEKSYHELNHGLRLYMSLGLEFVKNPNESMNFVFTQIDPQNPLRPFSFALSVDEANTFQLLEVSPPLEPHYCSRHLSTLRSDCDIAKFTLAMRKGFQQYASFVVGK